VPNLDRAKINVIEFLQEVFERLAAEQGGREREETTNVAGAA
jgi:hypothetical protein